MLKRYEVIDFLKQLSGKTLRIKVLRCFLEFKNSYPPMKILKFEDLLVWQKSIEITVLIYKHFEKHLDFGYSNQIRRASISISNNIAEGFERSTNKDFNRFLYIAKGSCSEVKSMLFLGYKLGYFSDLEMKQYCSQLDEIGKMLFGLSKSLKTDH